MTTDIKDIARLVATAIWADGVYADEEAVAVVEIAEAFELDVEAFDEAVDAVIAELQALGEDEVNARLSEACSRIDDMEVGHIYQALLQIALCDGSLGADEVTTLLALASQIGLGEELAVLMLADLVKHAPELEIDFE